MGNEVVILIVEAMVVYFLVLWAHSLRHRFGPVPFYAVIGGITAIMSWVTDAGISVQVGGLTFVIGSTVFYTSLLLGVFVVYVFDGPRATRIAISTVAGVSILAPVIAIALHFQMALMGGDPLSYIPLPSFRTNTASIITTLIDLIFLGIAWEYLGKPGMSSKLWLRAFGALLGVMWLDVILFATGAFAGTPHYWGIIQGTLISRFVISLFALPFLYGYLYWQNTQKGIVIENRPVLAILRQVAEIEVELTHAQQEIEQRKLAEQERDKLIAELQKTLSEVKTLRGLLPICSHCKSIRDDQGYWNRLEAYIKDHSNAELTHSICPVCAKKHYPEFTIYGDEEKGQ
ncbi:MAG: VUT family protein [Desulfatibacillum sp.]|nr:VUT family protein [Desulfatibacillum sp.]